MPVLDYREARYSALRHSHDALVDVLIRCGGDQVRTADVTQAAPGEVLSVGESTTDQVATDSRGRTGIFVVQLRIGDLAVMRVRLLGKLLGLPWARSAWQRYDYQDQQMRTRSRGQ